MIQIRKVKLEADLPKLISNVVISRLQGSFVPLISTVRREYWAKIGLSPQDDARKSPLAELAAGEIFISKSGDFHYVKFFKDGKTLECGCIQKSASSAECDDFIDSVQSVVDGEMKDQKVKWEPVTSEEAWRVLVSMGKSVEPSRDEIAAAKALQDSNSRRLLARILSSPSALLRDALGPEDRQHAQPVLELLGEIRLLTKDFVVLCKEKGQQILKVNSREAVTETSQKGLKCFLCGKPISEESVEEVLGVTDLGRKMLERNYWMSVAALEIFGECGLKDWVVAEDEEFLTLYARGFGEITLLALFDRKFSLGDAYLLNAKLSLSRARVGMVVALQGISPVFSEFIVESNPSRTLHFFESMSGLEEKMAGILDNRLRENVREIVAPFSGLTSVALPDLVCEKIF